MHTFINLEGCQHLYGWLELMVQHTPFKAEYERKVSQFSFIHQWCILWVLCGHYVCGPLTWLLVQWCINITHRRIDEFPCGVIICIDGWSSWYNIHHPRQRMKGKCPSFHSFTHGTSFGYCESSMDFIPSLGCLYNGVSTSPMYPLMN